MLEKVAHTAPKWSGLVVKNFKAAIPNFLLTGFESDQL